MTRDEFLKDVATATGEQFGDQGWEKAAEKMHERVVAIDELLTGTGKWGELAPTDPSGDPWTPGSISEVLKMFEEGHTGGMVKSGGLVNLAAGELITPASASGGGGGVYVTVNVEGSVSSERDLVEAIRKGLLRAQQSGKALVL